MPSKCLSTRDNHQCHAGPVSCCDVASGTEYGIAIGLLKLRLPGSQALNLLNVSKVPQTVACLLLPPSIDLKGSRGCVRHIDERVLLF
jgi:hypothetical protein